MNRKLSSPIKFWVGIDVSKKTFDAAFIDETFLYSENSFKMITTKSFPNNKQGAKSFLKWLKCNDVYITMEATGSYSTKLFKALNELDPDLKISIADPYKTVTFIRGLNSKVKTDSTDAKGLAIYCKERRPRLFCQQDEIREELKALTRERADLVEKLTGFNNRLKEGVRAENSKVVCEAIKSVIAGITEAIKKIEIALKELIKGNTALAKEFKLLKTIVGVGEITAATVMGEFGNLDRFKKARELSSYAGLTPTIYQSGTSVFKKPRMSKKGNPRVRKVLYMAALAAYRNPFFAEFKEKLLKDGKHKRLVIGAIMRKLLVIMRAIIITGKPFNKNIGFA